MEEYIDLASRKSDLERTELQKEKTGVFSGCYAKNPVNGEAIPIWVADYVLGRFVWLYAYFLLSLKPFAIRKMHACMLELSHLPCMMFQMGIICFHYFSF